MNCRHAQDELLAARDASHGAAGSSALTEHLQNCAECRAVQQQFAQATNAWRETEAKVTIPDAQQEWHAVRRRLRQGETTTSPAPHWWRRTLQFSAPLAAAAVIALVVWSGRESPAPPTLDPTSTSTEIAQIDDPWAEEFADHFAYAANVEYVETENEDASPFVYVDDESGWLIVWASAPADEVSI